MVWHMVHVSYGTSLCLMAHGICLMAHGLCLMAHGLCLMAHGLCLMVHGLCVMSYVLWPCGLFRVQATTSSLVSRSDVPCPVGFPMGLSEANPPMPIRRYSHDSHRHRSQTIGPRATGHGPQDISLRPWAGTESVVERHDDYVLVLPHELVAARLQRVARARHVPAA